VGQHLATVATTENVRVKFDVNADNISSFRVGSEVLVKSDILKVQKRGQVISVSRSADPMTRAFKVEALVDNSDRMFQPGMFARVDFIQETLKDVLAIPRRSVITLDNQTIVFVVEQGKAFKRAVTLGNDVDGHVVIRSGVQVGDTVVTLGQDFLEDEMLVSITELNGHQQ
jgi:RND family efflux transporter MFP subunit